MKHLLFFLALAVLLPPGAFAQNGTIKGIVVDQTTQERLPAANVQILGTTLGASTDPEGRFLIVNVPVGTYQIRASRSF
jgi:uncharacterized protein YaiL (DUF2058 family)